MGHILHLSMAARTRTLGYLFPQRVAHASPEIARHEKFAQALAKGKMVADAYSSSVRLPLTDKPVGGKSGGFNLVRR